MGKQIVISGLRVARNAVFNIMQNWNFTEEASDDYKKGFYDFGEAVLKGLDILMGKKDEQDTTLKS